jgi:hypothetical protein
VEKEKNIDAFENIECCALRNALCNLCVMKSGGENTFFARNVPGRRECKRIRNKSFNEVQGLRERPANASRRVPH